MKRTALAKQHLPRTRSEHTHHLLMDASFPSITLKPILRHTQDRERPLRNEGKDRCTKRIVLEGTISTGVLNALIDGIRASWGRTRITATSEPLLRE